ncbi:MAG: extracellular solute-binding protein, partial [bacterium]|nr:extracellular solute-binding protein [bacterium]
KTWDEFVSFVGRLTVRDASGNITQSGAAFGEFQNVDHAKDIISLLILQTGNPIVDSATFHSTLSGGTGETAQSSDGAIRFFTEFSDPAKTTYSWNRSLPGSKNAFIGGILAYYFGYAGEYNDIAAKNPHLNFDVAEVPQITGGHIRLTFAKMQGLAVSKSTPNITQAATAVAQLTGKDAIAGLVKKIFLPPIRRDLLAEVVSDPVLAVFYKSAIESSAWLEPDPEATNDMFRVMTESVLSGKKKISDAMRDANAKLNTMLEKFKPK